MSETVETTTTTEATEGAEFLYWTPRIKGGPELGVTNGVIMQDHRA